MYRRKILVSGYAGHGKTEFCEAMKISFVDTSRVALNEVIWPALKDQYKTPHACYRDRVNRRAEWFNLISEYNKHDKARLAKEVLKISDVYCGMRCEEELTECMKQDLFDITIWIDASIRCDPEPASSCTVDPSMFDIQVNNDDGLSDLLVKAERIGSFFVL